MAITGQQFMGFVRRNPIGFVAGVACVAILATIWFRRDQLSDVGSLVDERSRVRERQAANIVNSTSLKENYEEITKANATVQSRLIRAGATFDNVRYFTGLVEATGVKNVSPLSPGTLPKTASKGGFVVVPYNLVVSGSFEQLMNFLRELERGRHYARINTVSLQKAPAALTERGVESVTMTLSLEILGRI